LTIVSATIPCEIQSNLPFSSTKINTVWSDLWWNDHRDRQSEGARLYQNSKQSEISMIDQQILRICFASDPVQWQTGKSGHDLLLVALWVSRSSDESTCS
jgi:hypothetical protein